MSVLKVCVVYVIRDGADGVEVLLGRKLSGLGTGKVVAPGGKLEAEESPRSAALRELGEEVGAAFRVTSLRAVGVNRYRFPTRPEWDQNSHVFVARWRKGLARSSTELDPFWVPVAAVPYDQMWSDAASWLPAVLQGSQCGGEYVFAPDLTTLQSGSWA